MKEGARMNYYPRRVLKVTLIHLLLIVFAIIVLLPVIWMIVSSFKTNPEIFSMNFNVLPRKPSWQNYKDLFRQTQFVRWLVNSTVVATATTLFALFFSTLGGFAFAKYKFVGKEILFVIVLILVAFPKFITIIPVFSMLSDMNLTNTYWSLILPFAVNPYTVFLMRQYITSIPDELLDSGRIDGCNEFGLFFKIVVPLLKPAFGAAGVFVFMMTWNDYLFPLIMMRGEEMMLLPVGLASLNSLYVVEYGMIMAGATISTLPVVVMYLLMQKQMVSGLTTGAIK